MPDEPSVAGAATRRLRLGSRRSALALRQTEMVRAALAGLGVDSEIVTFSTTGDERLDVPLPAIGGKGVFTAELDAALLTGEVDACVHSLKDLPTEPAPGLDVGAVLPREDPRDVLLIRSDVAAASPTLESLPSGARVGTSSLRRSAMLRHVRPDLQVVDLRGNVPTRIEKLERGDMEAIVLAGAGLLRLSLQGRVTQWLDAEAWLPAPGQGIVAVQARTGDGGVRDVLRQVHHEPSWQAALAERSFLHTLEGGCQVPVAALAMERDGTLWLEGEILDVDGGAPVRAGCAVKGDAVAAGVQLAGSLLSSGGAALLARARASAPGGA